jgi:hypothetical protein
MLPNIIIIWSLGVGGHHTSRLYLSQVLKCSSLAHLNFISNTSRAQIYHRARYFVQAWLIYFSNEFELIYGLTCSIFI